MAEKRYSTEHQWVELGAAGVATVGITAHAAAELGDITFVELPAIGKQVAAGEALCVIESVKAASDVFAPVGGTVAEVNSTLDTDPARVNSDPEGAGWICRLRGVDAGELGRLLSATDYAAHLAGL
jgi:glycine cleavage system H protein